MRTKILAEKFLSLSICPKKIFFSLHKFTIEQIGIHSLISVTKNKTSEMSPSSLSSHFLSKHKYFIGKMLDEKISPSTTPPPSSIEAKTISQMILFAKEIGDYLISHSQSLTPSPTLSLCVCVCLLRAHHIILSLWIWWAVIVTIAAVILCYTQETAAVQHIFLAFPTPDSDSLCVCACAKSNSTNEIRTASAASA